MRRAFVIFLWITLAANVDFGAQSVFDPAQRTWVLNNGWIRSVFQLTQEGYFQAVSLSDLRSGDQWTASPARAMTPIRLQIGTDNFDAQTQYDLAEHYTQPISTGGLRQVIVLQDLNRTAQIRVTFELYDEQPVLRYNVRYKNLTSIRTYVNSANMLPWSFESGGKQYTSLHVNQWSVNLRPEDFEPIHTNLEPGGPGAGIYAGAAGRHCGWVAVRDGDSRGLFAGWEFDGRSWTTVRQAGSESSLEFSSLLLDLHHPVEPGDFFSVPTAFLGLFHGDFDEAGHRTHQFVNGVLAAGNSPDPKTFP